MRTGNFVIILRPPTYPGVLKGDLGKIASDYYLKRDGILNVDVIASAEEYVNLTFEPRDLILVNESDLQRGVLPQEANRERVLRQYKALKSSSPFYEKI